MSTSGLSQFQFEPYYPHLERFLEVRTAFSEPFSTRSEPFTQWSRQAYSFLSDDFCHTKPLVAKVAAKTTRSVIKLKQTVNTAKPGYSVSDQVKLWFDLPNSGTLFAKVKSSDYIKLHYDNGLKFYRGHYYYLFGGVNSSKLLNNLDVRVGLGHLSENSNVENRLKLSTQRDKNTFHWYHKTFLVHQRLRFGFLTVVDLNRTVFQKNNLLLGWQFRGETFGYLRAEVKGFRQQNINIRTPEAIFDNLIVDFVHRVNPTTKIGTQVTLDLQTRTLGEAKVVLQYQRKAKQIIKASVNNRLDIALLYKLPLYGLEDVATLSAGVEASGLGGASLSLKSGFELNLNL